MAHGPHAGYSRAESQSYTPKPYYLTYRQCFWTQWASRFPKTSDLERAGPSLHRLGPSLPPLSWTSPPSPVLDHQESQLTVIWHVVYRASLHFEPHYNPLKGIILQMRKPSPWKVQRHAQVHVANKRKGSAPSEICVTLIHAFLKNQHQTYSPLLHLLRCHCNSWKEASESRSFQGTQLLCEDVKSLIC